MTSRNSGGSGGISTAAIRAPRPYSLGDDFGLWVRRFEAYCRAVGTPHDRMCDSLLALLDDASFRAFDLLELTEETQKDYKLLLGALTKRFSPSTGQQELRLLLGQRVQQDDESLDTFADALLHLANRAYPDTELQLRTQLVLDRFVAGIRSEPVQDALLRTPPETLDDARTAAKRLEAAQTARKRMRARRAEACATSCGKDSGINVTSNPITSQQDEVAAVATTQDPLAEAVRRNTETLERLMAQLPYSSSTVAGSSQPIRRRPPGRCWQCGQRGHLRRDCTSGPSGNEQRPATWVNRRPQTH